MSEIIIDKELEFFLPPLDEATSKWLEDSVLEYGCRQPLVLWEGILIDGHHRTRLRCSCCHRKWPIVCISP